jgi:membrane protein
MVPAFGAVLGQVPARASVIAFVLENVPLREDRGRRELEQVLTRVTQQTVGFGVMAAVALLVTASAVMGAVRQALNRAWDVADPRPVVQAKLVDLLLVVGLGLLVALSFALTVVAKLAVSLSADLERALGPAASAVPRLLLELGRLAPVLIAFAAFTILFRLAPAARTRVRDVWPGAAVAALGFEATKTGFALYLAEFANYGAVYASLAAVVAFLVFVFVSANAVLLGAQVAVAWPRIRDGATEDGPGAPLGKRLRRAITGLVVHRPSDPSAP